MRNSQHNPQRTQSQILNCHNTFREQREILAGTRVKLYPGIGLSCWREDGAEAEKMTRHIQALRQDGLDGFTVFAFDGRAKETFPLLREGPTALRGLFPFMECLGLSCLRFAYNPLAGDYMVCIRL